MRVQAKEGHATHESRELVRDTSHRPKQTSQVYLSTSQPRTKGLAAAPPQPKPDTFRDSDPEP
ncbi:hypothetical protein Taro_039558 [Colocasia esculenta]|uniref:Uncharacterized protein n=1 Tax=Colocasia esculenta TaxID=4460 RepID=A0A843WAY7_COLES|nr:hypothetical protein [Colocasia esculenta]